MHFGYTIVYVPDVEASLAFFEAAFGFARRFIADTGDYGELSTGSTALAFAAEAIAEANTGGPVVFSSASPRPLGIELGFVTQDVAAAHARALEAGATQLTPPQSKPWGQTVSYLRCPDGTLVELCSPMN